eukprot:518643_1
MSHRNTQEMTAKTNDEKLKSASLISGICRNNKVHNGINNIIFKCYFDQHTTLQTSQSIKPLTDHILSENNQHIFYFQTQSMKYTNSWDVWTLSIGFIEYSAENASINDNIEQTYSIQLKDITDDYYGDEECNCSIWCRGKLLYKIKVNWSTSRGQTAGMKINMKSRTAELFINGRNKGVIFENIPRKVIPIIRSSAEYGTDFAFKLSHVYYI